MDANYRDRDPSWEKDFRSSSDGKTALRQLREELQSNISDYDFEQFEGVVLECCFLARKHDVEKDWDSIRYKQYQTQKLALPKQLEYIAEQLSFINGEHRALAAEALSSAQLKCSKEWRICNMAKEPKGTDEFMSLFLGAYAAELQEMLDLSKEDFLRYEDGCVRFGAPVRNTKRRHTSVYLMFELALRFHQWTKPGASLDERFGLPKQMPKFGKPHHKVIAAFVNATFPKNKTTATATLVRASLRELLRQNPSFAGWPLEAELNTKHTDLGLMDAAFAENFMAHIEAQTKHDKSVKDSPA